jgi:fructose-bisphosphate aldolase class II
MKQMLADAMAGGYAVCYCESWNLESLQAVVEAAEEMRAPSIAGFNGGFLGRTCRSQPERLVFYGGMAAALQESIVPVSLILNETDDLAQIEEGLEHGFNAVMVENHALAPEEYMRLVKQVVQMAHTKGVTVEAQVGHLPNGWDAGQGTGQITNPKEAHKFVAETGIDALGVSIGNVHIMTEGKASVDLSALARIREATQVPLVIHGGTGFPREQAREAIALGVAKFNFGTTLKQVYLKALREKLAQYTEPMNPHPFLGMGGEKDILVAAREAVKKRVKELIETYGFASERAKLE